MARTVGLLIALWACLAAHDSLAAEKFRFRFVTAIAADQKGVGIRQPEGVACNNKSAVVIGDTANDRLLRYTVEGRDIKPVGEIKAPQLASPIRVELSSKGELFALDGKRRRIARFSAAGEYKDYVTPEGVPAPTGFVPRALKLDRSDNLYVLDIFSARVLVLSPEGKYQRHVDLPRDRGFFSDLAVDARGTLFLVDSVKGEILVAGKEARSFSPFSKGLREHLSFPTSITLDDRGILYVVDQNGSGVVMLGQDGSFLGRQLVMGWTEGLVYYPSQMCVNDKGEAFIADRGNNRVQVFSIVR